MFSFFHKLRTAHLRRHLQHGWDMHCHILPGVDDGAADMETALSIISTEQSKGIDGAVCTPHIMARYPSNTPDRLKKAFSTLQELVTRSAPGFRLILSAEYMIDDLLPIHLSHPETLLTHPGAEKPCDMQAQGVRGSALLMELPQYMLPPSWGDMLLAPQGLGLVPLLAHPERYHRILGKDELLRLYQQGVRFQGNLGSLAGIYGPEAKELARSFCQRDLYSCWGTDVHSPSMLKMINL